MTTKWELRGKGDTAQEYARGEKVFSHVQLQLGEEEAEKMEGTV